MERADKLRYMVYDEITSLDSEQVIPSEEQNLKRNEPLEQEKDKAKPEKTRTAEREKYQAVGELEKKRTAERKTYQAEPETKRVAKRQRYWKSSEPGCFAKRVRYGEAKYTLEWPSKE